MPELKANALQVKVCGMRDIENIRAVSELGIDLMGFIFYAHSSRFVGALDPASLPLKAALKRVGVFVNAAIGEILEQVRRYRLDLVQLHGDESPADCAQLRRQLVDVQLIKAFRVASAADLKPISAYTDFCDYLLFDTKGKTYGGTGHSFDWQILEAYRQPTPFFLSGGIGPQSLSALARFQHPACMGIDVNSGFEQSPGLKAVDRLHAFLTHFKKNDR